MDQELATKQQEITLFKHTMRPNWGLAVLDHEDDDKKSFRFEDGKVRVFKKGYFEFLQPVDTPVDQSARTLARLGSRSTESSNTGTTYNALPVDAQIMCFIEKYPGGFASAAWQSGRRGVDAKRRLKRHRDAAVAEAQSFLSYEQMGQAMAAGGHAHIVEQLRELLAGSDLISTVMAGSIPAVFEERAIPLVHALYALLHDDKTSLAVRFERWFTELDRVCLSTPSWNLTTAPLALAQPERHVCVRIASFLRQAAWMAPRLETERAVTGRNYKRWLSMAERIKTVLDETGLQPRDLLDVHDFIGDTLKPKSIERARALHKERQ